MFNEFVSALRVYVPARQNLSEWRWRHLWRQHKVGMIEAQAAIVLGGEVLVHPDRMDGFLVQLGRVQALRTVEPAVA